VITILNSIKQKGSGGMSETIIRKMSEVELQEVRWLWKPYIPFGKLTIIQGDPGEGKTTFALRLAAACSSGVALPGMETTEPFNVIYQTAEDGLGDTIKPRLIEAGADENMVLNIIEDTDPLSLSDERIEKAIAETGARLMILLANGVPLKHIQEWLGHSDFSTTANIYAHLDYSSKISSAQAMENGLVMPENGSFESKWKTIENEK